MTAPRPGRIHVDAIDGVGYLSEEVITVEVALTSFEEAGKEREYSERPNATRTTTKAKPLG